jgi:hypothetical protein
MSHKPDNISTELGIIPFVELNRRFRRLKQISKVEEAALESYTEVFFRIDPGLTWDDLLKESRAVVLGEPGSGKSWEMQERARQLAAQGQFSFFVRLDQLAELELRIVLGAEGWERFTNWKSGNMCAFFFLDSVDEAKFRKISDFYAALGRFRHEIGSESLSRSKIFLSSRISEWTPHSDAFEFQRLFSSPHTEALTTNRQIKETVETGANPLVVQIEPLSPNQVESFARARGVLNVNEFTQALEGAFAWEG